MKMSLIVFSKAPETAKTHSWGLSFVQQESGELRRELSVQDAGISGIDFDAVTRVQVQSEVGHVADVAPDPVDVRLGVGQVDVEPVAVVDPEQVVAVVAPL